MDLISRGDALVVVQYNKDPVEGIKNLPAADAVEVVHSKWREQLIYSGSFWERIIMCPACRYRNDKKTNYCPNCGARMDGDSNE